MTYEMTAEKEIIKSLFQTRAIQICPEDEPFWYTSGTLGPYYINTHYLYGSKEEAETLLEHIGAFSADDKKSCPGKLFPLIRGQYLENPIFRLVIDRIVREAEKFDFDFISGGERRDFFFSILAANLLKKPHVSIFKDLTAVFSDSGFQSAKILHDNELCGQKALHIADLVTEASSYLRAWIPAIDSLGARMEHTVAVVDRRQGGREALSEKGVELHSFAAIQNDLFLSAKDNGYLNEKQYSLILQFTENPRQFMKDFIASHPGFLAQQIALGGKAKERAERYIEREYASE